MGLTSTEHVHQIAAAKHACCFAAATLAPPLFLAVAAHHTHLFHHLLHVFELFDKLVDVVDGCAAAGGDASSAAAIERVGVLALVDGHTADDRFHHFEVFGGFLGVYIFGKLSHPRDHF